MCDPLFGASLGVAALGAGLSLASQNAQQEAVVKDTNTYNDNFAAMLNQANTKQDQINDSNKAAFNTSVDNNSAATQQDQAKGIANNLTNQYVLSTAPPTNPNVGVGAALQAGAASGDNGAQIVNDSFNQSQNSLASYLKQQATAKGTLDAQTQQGVNQAVDNSNTGSAINFNNWQAQNNANQLQTDVGYQNQILQGKIANDKASGGVLGGLGSLFSGLGSAGTQFAGSQYVASHPYGY